MSKNWVLKQNLGGFGYGRIFGYLIPQGKFGLKWIPKVLLAPPDANIARIMQNQCIVKNKNIL